MNYKANSVEDYIDQIPEDRKEVIIKLHKVILEHLPNGFESGINYNMIGYYVPHSVYPNGYHCDPKLPLPFINLASQKNSINLYHVGIYAKKELLDWFVSEYPKYSKRKLDMGKSCIRFKYINEIPHELIADLVKKMTVKDWIETYEKSLKK
ncbi:DUF1801 domain-containing protein [Aureibaculum sp. A20]|uniref:DUF1801 domain-containing protein n=1 Tax=Aureibaculum flavum TaxID=2795986 RepID=A0ABS0WNG6_9FLAO|nr:DUF1801 domain-containing protein [Aureibaculum flavum]MBJ2173502.1 DUF1801 domain-containing protein [Aureibaculum flavum]